MDVKKFSVTSFFSAVILTTSLHAADPQTEQFIREELQQRHYSKLGQFLNKELSQSKIHLQDIKRLAQEKSSHELLRAVDATEHFHKENIGLGLSTGAFLQTALFIEADLKKYTSHGRSYLLGKKTRMPRTIECDRRDNAVFMVLDGSKSAFLGKGAKKTAYKSIAYNQGKPHVVARAQQIGGMDKELRITHLLKGARGIYSALGSGEHVAKDKKYTTIYSKLYNSGDLKGAFEKKMQFSLYEKVSIALNVLYGLEALHKHGIAHRDLGSKNFFLNIHGEYPRRTIDAVIADFGWSNFAKDIPYRKAQANFKNTAPEGINFERMKGAEYFGTDVFAAGMVLYHLVKGEKVAWQAGYRNGSLKARREKLTRKINMTTRARRIHLENLYNAGTISHEEALEYHVLRMVNPNPKQRPTATVLRQDMERLFHQVQ